MMSITDSQLFLLIKTARPKQWLKNLALYASLVFSGFFFYKPGIGPSYFYLVTYAFIIFCLLTSSTYILNDLIDVEADRKHPLRKIDLWRQENCQFQSLFSLSLFVWL